MIQCFTIQEVAEKLKMSPQTINRLVKANKIEAFDAGLGQRASYRVSRDSLESFTSSRSLSNSQTAPTQRPRTSQSGPGKWV